MELRMSRKERDRLKVVEQLNKGLIAQAQAAAWLSLSVRQVRRLLRAYQERGDHGLVHQGRNKPSNRRIDEQTVARAKELLRTRYRDFGPTLASEHLASDDGILASRETVRGWMFQQGLWGGQRKKHPHRHRRPRRACFGELIQMDTSLHDWLEGRGPACVLITMIDDASGRKLLHFFQSDSTVTNMTLIKLWIERHGRPLALYTDWASHFKQISLDGAKASQTQIERALGELDSRLIAAHSPQAKGRVERSHQTDQDRLIKEMRLKGIATVAAANRFLKEVYLPQMEQKFAIAPASVVDAHRAVAGYDLEAIFSIQEPRRVANDYTVQIDGTAWQIERGEITGGLRQGQVLVERRLDGSMRLRWGDRYLKYHQAPIACKIKPESIAGNPKAAAPAGVGGASFQEGSLCSPSFHSAPPTPAIPKSKHKRLPPPDHPWR